jgi:RNA polymerase sigma-70 factor (ECF subfamily)
MHDIDGHGMPEIAQALAVPLNTCYSRLRIARELFEKAVRRLLPARSEPES